MRWSVREGSSEALTGARVSLATLAPSHWRLGGPMTPAKMPIRGPMSLAVGSTCRLGY